MSRVLLQAIVNGVLLGGLLSLASLGFSLVWGVMGLLNVAHGTLIVLGSYLALFFVTSVWPVDPLLTVPVVAAVMFVFGFATQRVVLNRIIRADLLVGISLTFGLDLVLINLVLWTYDSDIRSNASALTSGSIELAGVVIPRMRLLMFAVALVLAAACQAFLLRSRYGRAIRAAAMDQDAARLSGISVERIYAWTFGLAAALAGAAGVMTAVVMPYTPFAGERFLNSAFVVTVLGGLGSVGGAVFGGMILGLAQSLAATYVGPGYQEVIGFLVFVVVLLCRPQGLFGTKFSG